jgi:hypothetical protein
MPQAAAAAHPLLVATETTAPLRAAQAVMAPPLAFLGHLLHTQVVAEEVDLPSQQAAQAAQAVVEQARQLQMELLARPIPAVAAVERMDRLQRLTDITQAQAAPVSSSSSTPYPFNLS